MHTRVLVTGGAGFIGSHYVRRLLGVQGPGGTSVTVLDKLTYAGNTANLDSLTEDPRLTFVRGDVCDPATVDPLVRGADHIVHCAAESHVDRSLHDGTAFLHTNVLGTQTLLDAALRHGTDTFVHVSTDEVYGSVPAGSSSEDSALRPGSPYAASKASSDLVALAYANSHGMDVRVTRCSNNYGPRQYPEKIIPLFVTNLLRGARVPLYGDGSHIRDWLHVDDHVRAIDLVRTSGSPGGVYNIGGGTELSNTALTDLLLRACGADWDAVEWVADRPGHDLRYSVDWTKIRRTLGYRPRYDITTGIAETVAWYRENPGWWEPLKKAAPLRPPRAHSAGLG